MQIKPYIQRINIELFIWPAALVALFFMNPGEQQSFCVLKWLGAPWCPGCGLGHSINATLHGEWQTAFKHHPAGPFAVTVLLYRTFQLGRALFYTQKYLT